MLFFWLSLAWSAGIVAGQQAHQPAWAWLLFAGGSFLAGVLFRQHRLLRAGYLALLAFGLGAARSTCALPPSGPHSLAYYNDTASWVTLEGWVDDAPDVRDTYVGLRVQVERLRLSSQAQDLPVRGRVLLYAPRLDEWAYGDRISATGQLSSPPVYETFSYRDHLARQGVHSLMPDARIERLAGRQGNPILQALTAYRARAVRTVYTLFPDPEASLLAGILLGIESGIPASVRQAFDRTGTAHIIAISGFNITIIAALFINLFGRWFGARQGSWIAGAAIAVYTVLVGADPPVVRAAIMGGMGLIARRIGRQTEGLNSLALAGLGMTLANPLILWDAGFQLSFAATLGLILYATPLRDGLVAALSRHLDPVRAERIAGPVAELGLFTLAAQATTLPLTVYYFRRLSLVSLIANPLILPAQPAVMALGGLATLAGTVWEPAGRALSWLAWPFAAFTVRSVELLDRLPLAAIPLGPVTLPTVIAMYALLFGLSAPVWLPPERRPRFAWPRIGLPSWIGWGAAASAALLVWLQVAARPDGRLHVTVLDVGNGDGVLVQSPAGRYVLIDGGPSALRLSEALGRRLPTLRGHIDWLVLAGTEDEQLAGIAAVIERFPVGSAWVAGEPSGKAYDRIAQELSTRECPIVTAQAGQALDLGDGASLEILSVGDRGAVLLLTHGRLRFLMAPGADPAMIADLARRGATPPVTAVLLADGGYAAVNPANWLKQINPWLAVLSVEAGDGRGRPSPETLEALTGVTLLRTDRNGWIELISDGQRVWIEVERQPAEAGRSTQSAS